MTANRESVDASPPSTPSPRATLLVGVVFLAMGIVVLVQTFSIPGPQGLDLRGPRAMPLAIAVIWLVLGTIYLTQQVLRLRHPRGPATGLPSARRLAVLVALLIGYALGLAPLGYIAATAVFWVAAARILGSRQWRRDLIVAVGLSLSSYLFFVHVLSIRLPAGVIAL